MSVNLFALLFLHNRGYFARWAALRKLLNQFLDTEKNGGEKGNLKKQVLSLGAGFDTTYFQLQDEGRAPHLYVELDFKEVRIVKHSLLSHWFCWQHTDFYMWILTNLG